MKKILVPTDFSKEAENALKVAAQLAKKYNAEIFLLHMLELPLATTDPVSGKTSSDLPEALFFLKLAKKRFSEILSQPYLKTIKVHETVEFEHAFAGIMETSKKYNCDFIVMGSQGATGLKEMFIGSNTEKVVRHSEIPVLVIKDEHENFKVDNFVFATNLNPAATDTLRKVVDFARFFQARLYLVYVNTTNEFVTSGEMDKRLAQYQNVLSEYDYQFSIYNDESIEQGILNFADKVQADLIGIATHGRKGLSHFFNGSISEDLVNHSPNPIVTFKLDK